MPGILSRLSRTTALCLMACVPLATTAQASSPTSIVITAPPGGAADMLARVVGMKLAPLIDQTVIVENRPGANATIGTRVVSQAKPDGKTLLLVDRTTVAANPLLFDKLPYDPQDITGVSDVAKLSFLFVVGNDTPYQTWEEMVAYARANPGKITVGSSGVGSGMHLSMELIARALGTSFTHVPYTGMAPAMQDVLAGNTDAVISGPEVVIPHLNSGKLRVLASGGDERHPMMPNVPTMRELGFGEPLLLPVSFAIYAPRGTPEPTISSLNASLRKVMSDPEVVERLTTAGLQPSVSSPGEVAETTAQLATRLEAVIREIGLKPN